MMLMMVVLPAVNVSAAERLTNPHPMDGKLIDGIDADPEVGIHNSYAWCGAVFPQADADYLWIGSNRDSGAAIFTMAGALLGGSVDPVMYGLTGIPEPSDDRAAKIYRYNLNDPDAGWELMYENPAFNGYRKMIVFNEELYVFVAASNRVVSEKYPQGFQYSAVYRFANDFEPGDEPEVVHWVRLPAIQYEPIGTDPETYRIKNYVVECYRSAFVYDGMLYVGTFDGKIYRTDGTGLTSLTPVNNVLPGVYQTGWDLVADLDFPTDNNTATLIWDITVFKGSLYVFVTGSGVDPGFKVYKLTEEQTEGDDNWEIKQIVGGEGAFYPSGLGISGHVAATPRQFGDYLYVATSSTGPAIMALALAGYVEEAFDYYYTPSTIYRFAEDDDWEVVVGDSIGKNVAVGWDGEPIRFADGAGTRAGFYIGGNEKNSSANMYFWQMVVYDGKLYVSTWDIGVFRDTLPLILLKTFADTYGENLNIIMQPLTNVIDIASVILQNVDGSDYIKMASDISDILTAYQEDLNEAIISGDYGEVRAILGLLADDIAGAILDTIDISDPIFNDLRDSISDLFDAISSTSSDLVDAMNGTIDMIGASAFFYLDRSNPAGFDIFCSEDGVTWEPVTLNGLGDENNYGGRVLLPTEKYGLFVLTANPFTGCQAWLMNGDITDVAEISGDIPENISVKAGDSVSFSVTTIGLSPVDLSVRLGDGTAVKAEIEMIEYLGPSPKYYFSTIDIVTNALTLGQPVYVETEDPVPMYLYKVTLKGLKEYGGTLDLRIEIDGMSYDGQISVRITGEQTDWFLFGAIAAIVAVGLIAATYIFVIRKP